MCISPVSFPKLAPPATVVRSTGKPDEPRGASEGFFKQTESPFFYRGLNMPRDRSPKQPAVDDDPRADPLVDGDRSEVSPPAIAPLPPPATASPPASIRGLSGDLEDKTVWPLADFCNDPVNARAAIEWVAANLCVRPLEVKVAPNSTAWGLLIWADAGAANKSAFYQMWAKLLPTRAQADEQDAIDEDDADLLADIEFIYKAKCAPVLPLGAENPRGEPRLPHPDAEADRPA
jgi:hypothetical protein